MKSRWRVAVTAIVVVLSVPACSSGNSPDATPAPDTTTPDTTTPDTTAPRSESPLRGRPLPAAVEVAEKSGGDPIADPAFRALPGARAEYGRLGGSAYQIEIPDKWNGRLVLWMHGFAEYSGVLQTGPPDIRRWLISHGYAWGASSFSSTSLIPGLAADETAALWDHFVAKHGRPKWTYAGGGSMGGWAAAIAAQRYGNRFDGALGLCGAVGAVPGIRVDADFFVAAAFVAGVTQAEYDASTDIGRLIDDRIMPALADPATRVRFVDIVIGLTGGPRAFDREGLEAEMATKWRRARLLVGAHLAPQPDAPYRLTDGSGVTSEEFNRKAIRLSTDEAAFRTFAAGTEVTGKLAMPLLMMHTTGDGQVPINQAQILRTRVEAAGKSGLLAQRVFEDPGHCGFSTPEQEVAMDALVHWVEGGRRPATTNLGVSDLRTLEPTFELEPRRAEGTTGAAGNVTFRGTARLDGKPFDAQFIGAVVIDQKLVTPCNVTIPTIVAGRYALGVYGAQTSAGCGRGGARVVLWTYVGSQKLFATNALDWPDESPANAAVDFSTSDPAGAAPALFELAGEVHRADGSRVGPGALVEASIGTTRCGVASIRRGVFAGYIMHVVGPDSIAGCRTGAEITFRVDGALAVATIANGGEPPRGFDLTLR